MTDSFTTIPPIAYQTPERAQRAMAPESPVMQTVELMSEPPSLHPSPLFEHHPSSYLTSHSDASELVSTSLRFSPRRESRITLDSNQERPLFKTTPVESLGLIPESALSEDDVFDDRAIDSEAAWQDELDDDDSPQAITRSRSNSSSTTTSDNSATAAWSELERAEEAEARGEGSDEATAFLLARLEQENQALATDPKFGLRRARSRKQSRPPSLQMLKRLVEDRANPASRYSLPQDPPPMTELEFWTALVQDYSKTAQRLPTLTSGKIKAGVPPPLRGVVWVSMAGARDADLAMEFEKLSLEPSPYENLIGKDVGRSFPGVEMFRDPDGEGQNMLGRVLKCFSLYDKEIGYCQGLGFLVGPLLMNMGDKDAFCVLVRLMENYDLRSCFLPSLSGLHVRVFQFQRLLTEHLPTLAAHLASLQVEAAYLAQWFLSFFAVTCPLPMLFRIYDVIFAEGASETIMRVALSLMRRNEFKLRACTEFEEVMHILLSRALWDTYACNADDFVNDFMGMTKVVTRESLQNLSNAFKEAHGTESSAWFAFLPDASAAASKFLGRLWTSSTPAKTGGLAPRQVSSFRPVSFLRRSPSTSTFTSNDASMDSAGTLTTEATLITRDSPPASIMIPVPHSVSKEDKDLHSQIEDLLTALSEQQRQNAQLMAEFQKEREERTEDHRVFQELIDHLKTDQAKTHSDRRQTLPYPLEPLLLVTTQPSELNGTFTRAVERLVTRQKHHRQSSVFETKQCLRESLEHSREQLEIEMSRSATLSRQLDDREQETTTIREQLREAQSRLQDSLRDKQKLERTITGMQRARSHSSVTWSEPDTPPIPTICRSDTADSRMSFASVTSNSGLRELKLKPDMAIPNSAPSHLNPMTGLPRRTTSLATQSILSTEDHIPAQEDALLVELVSAKTSEAVARQELEEVKAKLDAMRKMLGIPTISPPAGAIAALRTHKANPSDGTMMTPLKPTSGNEVKPAATPTSGGFWGWGKKSPSVSSFTTNVS